MRYSSVVIRRVAIVLGAALAIAAPAASAANASPPVVRALASAQTATPRPPLTAVGSNLVDAAGTIVVLHGIDEGRLDLGSGSSTPDACGASYAPLPAGEFESIAAAGFNSVRIAVSWENLEPTAPALINGRPAHRWNGGYLQALDAAIAAASAAHLLVILDMHQSGTSPAFKNQVKVGGAKVCEGEGLPTWLFPNASRTTASEGRCAVLRNVRPSSAHESAMAGMAAAWTELAKRYADHPWVVGADLLNEPDPAPGCLDVESVVTSDQLILGRAVAAMDPKWLLIFEDNSNYYNNHHHYLQRPSLPNSVYSFHFYPSSLGTGRRDLNAFLARAQAWHLPLYMGEFNAFGGNKNSGTVADEQWHGDTLALTKKLRDAGVSWSLWEYSGTMSLAIPGTVTPKPKIVSAVSG